MRRSGRSAGTIVGAVAGLCTLSIGALLACAAPQRFTITPERDDNLARFESKAPLESFDGRTRRVAGHVTCDPFALGDSVTVEVAVDLASLDTGIGLRNQHMRENHLETARFPQAVFRGGRLHGAPAALVAGETARFEIQGELELHGVTRPWRAPVSATLHAEARGHTLHVVSEFPLSLADFEVKRPQFLMLKLADVQQITLEVTAASAGADPAEAR